MKRFLLMRMSFIVVLTAPLLHAAEAAEPSDHGTTMQEILVLNSYHPGYTWSDSEQAGIIDVFRAKDENWLPVIEYLELKRLPDGKGEEILIEARVLAVATALEDVTAYRNFRNAFPLSEALEKISSHSGSKYDPEVVEACLRLPEIRIPADRSLRGSSVNGR